VLTISFQSAHADVVMPPWAAQLEELGAVDGGQTAPGDTTNTGGTTRRRTARSRAAPRPRPASPPMRTTRGARCRRRRPSPPPRPVSPPMGTRLPAVSAVRGARDGRPSRLLRDRLGADGLVAAITMARAGKRVTVLEPGRRRWRLPDGRADRARASATTCAPRSSDGTGLTALRDLPLASTAWCGVHPDIPLAHPLPSGAALLHRSLDHTALGLGADGDAWRRLMSRSSAASARSTTCSRCSRCLATRSPSPLRVVRLPGAERLARRRLATEGGRALFGGLAGHAAMPLDRCSRRGRARPRAYAHLVAGRSHQGGSQSLVDALVPSSPTRRDGRVRPPRRRPRRAAARRHRARRRATRSARRHGRGPLAPRARRRYERFRRGPARSSSTTRSRHRCRGPIRSPPGRHGARRRPVRGGRRSRGTVGPAGTPSVRS
jgi:hypothetical protein